MPYNLNITTVKEPSAQPKGRGLSHRNEMDARRRYRPGNTLSMLLLGLAALHSTQVSARPHGRQVIDRLRAPPTKARRPRDRLALMKMGEESFSIGRRRPSAAAAAAAATTGAAAIAVAVTLVGVTHPAERRLLNGPHSY